MRCLSFRSRVSRLSRERRFRAQMVSQHALRRTGARPRCLLHLLSDPSCDMRAPDPSTSPTPVIFDFPGQLDVQRCLFNLHRRRFVLDISAAGRHGQNKTQAFSHRRHPQQGPGVRGREPVRSQCGPGDGEDHRSGEGRREHFQRAPRCYGRRGRCRRRGGRPPHRHEAEQASACRIAGRAGAADATGKFRR